MSVIDFMTMSATMPCIGKKLSGPKVGLAERNCCKQPLHLWHEENCFCLVVDERYRDFPTTNHAYCRS